MPAKNDGGAAAEPVLIVIMGATGDLARRKALPTLYRLWRRGTLHARTQVLGVARDETLDDPAFRRRTRQALLAAGVADEAEVTRWSETCLHYQPAGRGDAEAYRAVVRRLEALERAARLPARRLFYLALPPQAVPEAVAGLGGATVNPGAGWPRVVVEKPFGRDLASAQALNRLLHEYFDERQIYRIDHFLGKETVQNLLVFRFANPLFESVWHRDRVERVEITVAEEIGIAGRAAFYEQVGAMRDMVQNHLTQLLTLVAMEVPGAFDADAIRQEKVKVLRAVRPIDRGGAVFGQYTSGTIGGHVVPGYREEAGVAPESTVETFVALRLEVANWRWHGVPFILRTGKRLARRLTEIVVTFRCPPVSVFQPFESCRIHSNALVITLQPDEGFDLAFEVKAPGMPLNLQTQRLHFRYAEAFAPLPDAYETLLLDVLAGDQTLFVRADEVEAAWRLYTPILEHPPTLRFYAAGTWGPAEADRLSTAEAGRSPGAG
jgi:glucose-6-phosphate 1-dehydrogenase